MISRVRVLFAFSMCVFTGTAAMASDIPSAAIPLIGNSGDFHLDGVVDEGFWSNAAHFNRITLKGTSAFTGVSGSKKSLLTPVETEFLVCFDEENLYIAAICHEDASGYPEAYPRQPQDTMIMNDDAVMVVIGDSNDELAVGGSLDMGGYEGAYSKLSDAQFYYTYTVNSAGSMARAFNETPLKRVLFNSKVFHAEDFWSVEIKIPLASCGIDISNLDYEKEIFANLIRIRPPDMMGWHLPRYGHYADMPLAKFRFLPSGRESEATQEQKPPVFGEEDIEASYRLQIGYFPLGGMIAGTVTQAKAVPGTRAVLLVDGKKRGQIKLDTPNKYVQWHLRQSAGLKKVPDMRHVVFDIPKGSQSAERKATVEVRDADDRLIDRKSRMLPAVEAPEWFGKASEIGAGYLEDKVLRGWQKPVLSGKTIVLANKRLTIAPNGLFEKIEDENGNMLSGASRLYITVDGKEIEFTPKSQKIELENNKVRIRSVLKSGGRTCEVKTLVDYDGFTVVKLLLDHVPVEAVDRVAVKIPLKHDRTKFIYRTVAEEVEPVGDYGFGGTAGQFWVGDHHGGLGFSFDSFDLFLSENRRKQIELAVEDDTSWLALNFVDEAGQISDGKHVFRFFLQPSPTKKHGMKKVRDHWISYWETWTPHQGYADTNQIPKIKDWLVERENAGEKGLLYVGHALGHTTPYFEEFKEDLIVFPERVVYWRGGKSQNNPCYLTSKTGPAADQQFTGMSKILDETDVVGVISDGFILPWEDLNPSHEGNVYQETLWDADTPSKIVAMRDFIKRYKGMFEDKKPEVHMMEHTGGAFSLSTSSLFDSYLDGEPLGRFKRGYQIPLHKFFAYTGHAWGVRSMFWEKRWRKGRGVFWSFTYGFLHDIEISNDTLNYRIFEDFEDEAETTLFPYWLPNPHVKLQSGDDTKMTCYIKEDAALVAVGNFSYYTDPVEVDLSRLFPGKDVRIQDMLTGQDLPHRDRMVCGDIEGWKLMLFKVSPVVGYKMPSSPDAEPFAPESVAEEFLVKQWNKEDWELSTSGRGAEWEEVALGERNALRLSSKLHGSPACLGAKKKFGRNAYIHFKTKFTQRFDLYYGPVRLRFGPLDIIGKVDGWNEGYINKGMQPEYNEMNDIVVMVNDGVFNVLVNGHYAIRDMRMVLPEGDKNVLTLQTWAGDEVVVDIVEMTNKAKKLDDKGVKHPVL